MLPTDSLSLSSTILITCPQGIGPYLEKEVKDLGFRVTETSDASVSTSGTLADCMVLNLRLSTAHRVLFFVEDFLCKNPEDLYRKLSRLPWELVLTKDSYLSITSLVRNPSITDTRFPNMKAKDAIVDRLVAKIGARCDSGPERTGTVVHLHWIGTRCAVYLDTSGESLSKRGYRRLPESAPLQETLAAAIIRASIWNRTMNFVNPMCGSGTLAIEAALRALNRPPGFLRRNFGFMHLPGYNARAFENLHSALMAQGFEKLSARIIATDISPRAIDTARRNAKLAGVENHIEFKVCPFQDTELPEGGGVILINPGYGHRMGDEEELAETYHQIGDFFKRKAQGFTGYVFTANKDLAKKIGLKTKRRIPFFNGDLECRLLEFELYSGSRKGSSDQSEPLTKDPTTT